MSYYFPHDYDALNDDKLLQVRGEFGTEGYALFWMCLETMAKNEDSHLIATLLGGLSLGYGVPKDRLLAFLDFCVGIDLFKRDDVGFFSERMLEHKKRVNLLSISGKKGAERRWRNSPPIAPPLAPLMQIREDKIKEKKIREESESEATIVAIAPKDIAKRFFEDELNQSEAITALVEKGMSPEQARSEMLKFISYWTEPERSGKRQRWEREPTFEIGRRLATWFSRVKTQNKGFNQTKTFVI